MLNILLMFPRDLMQLRPVHARLASAITMDAKGRLTVPDEPIIPFIEGDGTGPDIWKSSVQVFDAAVKKAYGGKRQIKVCTAQ